MRRRPPGSGRVHRARRGLAAARPSSARGGLHGVPARDQGAGCGRARQRRIRLRRASLREHAPPGVRRGACAHGERRGGPEPEGQVRRAGDDARQADGHPGGARGRPHGGQPPGDARARVAQARLGTRAPVALRAVLARAGEPAARAQKRRGARRRGSRPRGGGAARQSRARERVSKGRAREGQSQDPCEERRRARRRRRQRRRRRRRRRLERRRRRRRDSRKKKGPRRRRGFRVARCAADGDEPSVRGGVARGHGDVRGGAPFRRGGRVPRPRRRAPGFEPHPRGLARGGVAAAETVADAGRGDAPESRRRGARARVAVHLARRRDRPGRRARARGVRGGDSVRRDVFVEDSKDTAAGEEETRFFFSARRDDSKKKVAGRRRKKIKPIRRRRASREDALVPDTPRVGVRERRRHDGRASGVRGDAGAHRARCRPVVQSRRRASALRRRSRRFGSRGGRGRERFAKKKNSGERREGRNRPRRRRRVPRGGATRRGEATRGDAFEDARRKKRRRNLRCL